MSTSTHIPAAATRIPRRSGKRMRTLFGKDWNVAYPFVLPMVLVMVGLILWPFIEAIRLSGTSLNFLTGETGWVGFRNYARLWDNSDYHQAIGNTVRFTFWSLLWKFIVGMTIAMVLNSRLPWRNVLSGIMLLPWIVPEIVTALTWKSIYDPLFGSLNPILLGLGVIDQPQGWLSDHDLAMPSIIVVNIWKGIPFFVLLLLAGLKAVDREQLEAAEIDGASAVQRFRHVILPSMRYVIVVTLLLSFISTFNQFGLPFLMTQGGPSGATKLYSILAYEKAIASLQYGPGTAIAFSVAPLMVVVIWLLARFMRADDKAARARTEPGLGDRVLRVVGRLFSAILDLVFWPAEMALRLWTRGVVAVRRALGKPPGQPMLGRRGQRRASLWGRLLVLSPFMLFVLFPFYWVLITSLKTTPQISERRSIFWPEPFTGEQYRSLIQDTPFLIWLGNSVFVAAAATLISVAFASLAAYALSRLKFRGAGLLTTFLLITYLLPGTLLFIPLYQILSNLGIINSYAALIATYPTFLLPFATWVLLGYFRSIPVELEEAAMIDGASRIYAFWKITLPLAAPAILAVTLFAFTTAWNEFLFAFVFITSENLRTLPIGLQSMVVGDILPWGKLMAASLLTAIPVAVLYIYAQRYLAEGLTVGGVKG
ncbi:ABC transporter permease [Wenxinia marina]|uniref:ABC-type sugar transport system, permease component n=1 Tax=Wenxinia marina DSM 24838 TaxID=1123501 RepID=A0A0D0PEF7_9RHOB|nr:ABC transporter permease subunit [Wenxinia marina]KIQ69786.1 ABC-type sugar transport system, permease component [Wenxinia marina DSM 24838]GGL61187.1 sugar ABC transporter permease [Wenxinia marina]